MYTTETEIAAGPGPLRNIDGATIERRKGIYIAHLRGTYREMGRQHARLAAETCGDVVPKYMNGLIEKMVAHAVPLLARSMDRLLKSVFHFRNRDRIGAKMREHLAGLAEGFGVPAKEFEESFFVPDILHYLAGRALPGLAFPPMCSGFFACGEATLGGKVLIGRNFDFFGRGVWNTCNALVVMHPSDGQAFCWVGALGSPCSGQGFNESGLVISLHTKFVRDVNTSGTPLFSMCHRILAECGSLEEAIACVTEVERLCGLTIFIADTKARTAAAVGFSARHYEVIRPENGTLVRTNHYISEAMRKFEVAPHAWQRNTRGRFQRVTELLAEKRGALEPEDVPGILSDCVDPFEGCKRIVGSIVAGANNSQSLTISPDDDAIWIGNSDYPVCHSERFAGFRVSALFAGDRDNYEIEDLAGGAQLDTNEQAALTEYEQAWSEHLDKHDNERAIIHLLRAAELLPTEPIFPRMAGILLMKQRKYGEALPLLLRNTEYAYNDALMHAEAHIWAARCLDLLQRRAEALVHYGKAKDLNAPPVSTAAARHLTQPFRWRNLLEVSPEFVIGTALAKY